jgi:hypothetical protein
MIAAGQEARARRTIREGVHIAPMKDLQLLLFFFCVQREILCLLLLACFLAEVL